MHYEILDWVEEAWRIILDLFDYVLLGVEG
jgi:hypothetical protein